jgi:anti-sigma factor RsiW
MNCDRWQAMLDAYADESCSPEEIAALDDHLRSCPACAVEALNRIQAKRAIRAAAARFAPSPEFRLRIGTLVQEKSKPARRFGRPTWMPGLAWAAVAAILIVAFLGSVALWTRHVARQQAEAELLDLHIATLASANPVDVISTDRHTVKPWFQGKLPFTFNLPELQNSSYKLLGGKLVYFDHSPGAQLLFELGKHQLSVFILQDQPSIALPGIALPGIALPGSVAGSSREKGFSVESWSRAGLRYVVISDASPTDVHALSELLRAAAGP